MQEATEHPAYNDAIGYAVQKAQRKHGDIITVSFDGAHMFVREDGFRPEGAQIICIVQSVGQTVRMRFPRDCVDMMGRPRPSLRRPFRN